MRISAIITCVTLFTWTLGEFSDRLIRVDEGGTGKGAPAL